MRKFLLLLLVVLSTSCVYAQEIENLSVYVTNQMERLDM